MKPWTLAASTSPGIAGRCFTLPYWTENRDRCYFFGHRWVTEWSTKPVRLVSGTSDVDAVHQRTGSRQNKQSSRGQSDALPWLSTFIDRICGLLLHDNVAGGGVSGAGRAVIGKGASGQAHRLILQPTYLHATIMYCPASHSPHFPSHPHGRSLDKSIGLNQSLSW